MLFIQSTFSSRTHSSKEIRKLETSAEYLGKKIAVSVIYTSYLGAFFSCSAKLHWRLLVNDCLCITLTDIVNFYEIIILSTNRNNSFDFSNICNVKICGGNPLKTSQSRYRIVNISELCHFGIDFFFLL